VTWASGFVPRGRASAATPVLLALLALALPGRLASAEWADWTLDAGLETSFDSNLNRASRAAEEEWDVSFRTSLQAGRVYQVADRTRFFASAELAGDVFSRFDELNTFEGGAGAALLHKFGLADAPWARLSVRGSYRYVQDAKRSGPDLRVAGTFGKRFSPRLAASLEYQFQRRWGGSGPLAAPGFSDDVFDQEFHLLTLEGSFLVTERLLGTLGFSYRRGDFDSNARSNRFQILAQNHVEAVAMDRVFGGWVYRIDGNGYSPFARLNYGLGRRWSIDLGYRFQYGEGGGLDYRNHRVHLAALFRY
jgi:hypothetical protein